MYLGYYISPTKSTVVPTQRMVHLGFGIDASISSYYLTDKYRRKFQAFREGFLSRGTANLLDLQKWVGKCNHLRLLFPANSLFTFECRQLMSSVAVDRVALPPAARDEIAFWSFVDSSSEPVPFLLQQHASFRLHTDASGFGWGAHVSLPTGPLELRDYWDSRHFRFDICSKEALAVFFALRALSPQLRRRRVDVFVDNEGLVHAWRGLKSKSPELVSVLRELFLFCVDSRIKLSLLWVPTAANPADAPSRVLDGGDSMLSAALRLQLWSCYGPFTCDLMALPSNALRSPAGARLPFFSREQHPSAAGLNVFAQPRPRGRLYVFPPFTIITPLIKLFLKWGDVEVVMVLPVRPCRPGPWCSLLHPYIADSVVLCPPASVGVLLFPSTSGYGANLLPLPFGLMAVRCLFPRSRLPPPPPPPARDRHVVIFGDSMLRPFQSLSWPAPFAVSVRCFSGATLDFLVRRCLLLTSRCDILVLHGGVNDASRGGASFIDNFSSSCDSALRALKGVLGVNVAISTICLTKSGEINLRVAAANECLRGVARSGPYALISNDNIRVTDLTDTVHLNAAGTARLYNNILQCLESFVS